MVTPVFFESILVTPPVEKIYRRLGYEKSTTKLTPAHRGQMDRYITDAISLLGLKGAACRAPLEKKDSSRLVLGPDAVFESAALAGMVGQCDELLLMGATAGPAIVEAIAEDARQDNLSRGVVYDAVASEMVDAGLGWITAYFNRQLRRENRHVLPRRFSAGFGDFTLNNQKTIFSLLRMDRLGVSITEQYMLVPEKTVTAVTAIGSNLSRE